MVTAWRADFLLNSSSPSTPHTCPHVPRTIRSASPGLKLRYTHAKEWPQQTRGLQNPPMTSVNNTTVHIPRQRCHSCRYLETDRQTLTYTSIASPPSAGGTAPAASARAAPKRWRSFSYVVVAKSFPGVQGKTRGSGGGGGGEAEAWSACHGVTCHGVKIHSTPL